MHVTFECQPLLGSMLPLAHAMIGKRADDITILDGMAVAMGDDPLQFVFQLLQAGDFFPHIGKMFGGDAVCTLARHFPVLAERDQLANGVYVQAEIARVADEGQPFEIGFS